MDLIAVPLYTGAAAALEAQFLLNERTIQVPIIGRVDARLGLGVHTALASLVGQAAGQYVLPMIESGAYSEYKDKVTMLTTPVLTGLATTGLLALSENRISGTTGFLVGASSNLIGQYVHDIMKQ